MKITFYTRPEDSSRPKMSGELYRHLDVMGYEFQNGFFDPEELDLMLHDIQEFDCDDHYLDLVSFLENNLEKRIFFDFDKEE